MNREKYQMSVLDDQLKTENDSHVDAQMKDESIFIIIQICHNMKSLYNCSESKELGEIYVPNCRRRQAND